MMYTPWKPSEDRYLVSNYRTKSDAEIGSHLRRSAHGVIARRRTLGLLKQRRASSSPWVAPEPDAAEIEHLKWAIHEMTTPPEHVASGLPRLSVHRSRVLGRLLKSPGAVVTRSNLLAAMYWDRQPEDWPEDQKILDIQIFHVRKALRETGIEIENVFGVGFVARVPAQMAAE